MITALLLLAQSQSVTFTHPCANAAVVLEALGKQLGERMTVGGSVNNDYFAVRFTDRSPEDVKRLIAETLNAEWVQRGEYLVLDRGPKQEQAEQEARDSALRGEIEKYLQQNPGKEFDAVDFKKRVLDALAAGDVENLNSAAMQELRKYTPDRCWNPKIVQAFGSTWLSSIEDGRTVEFKLTMGGSSDMPPAVKTALISYLADCDKAREIATPLGVSLINLPGRPSGDSPLKLRINRHGNRLMVTMQTGDLLVLGSPTQTRFQVAMIGWRGAVNAKPPHASLSGKLGMREPQRSLVRVVGAKIRRTVEGVEPLTLAERETAVKHGADLKNGELLGLFGTLPMEQVADQLKYDYVALVDDRQILFGTWLPLAETATLEQVWQSWGDDMAVTIDEQTGVLKIRPEDRRSARDSRFDRDVAAKFAASFAKNTRVTLDAAAELALQSKSESNFSYNSAAACLLLPASQPLGAWAALRVYGALNPGQRRQAEDGGVVFEWGDLPRAARKAVEQHVLRGLVFFADQPPLPVRWHTFSVTYQGSVKRGSEMPESIPADAKVRILCWRTTGLMPKQPLPENDYGVYTPELIARFGPKGPIRSEGDLAPSKPDSMPLAVIDAERVQVEVYLPNQGYTAFAAHVSSQTDLTTFYAVDKLPEPWKTQLAEAIKKNGGGRP